MSKWRDLIGLGEHKDQWDWQHRWDALARYNTQRGQGIVHTPEYVEMMAEQQAAFNREQAAKYTVVES